MSFTAMMVNKEDRNLSCFRLFSFLSYLLPPSDTTLLPLYSCQGIILFSGLSISYLPFFLFSHHRSPLPSLASPLDLLFSPAEPFIVFKPRTHLTTPFLLLVFSKRRELLSSAFLSFFLLSLPFSFMVCFSCCYAVPHSFSSLVVSTFTKRLFCVSLEDGDSKRFLLSMVNTTLDPAFVDSLTLFLSCLFLLFFDLVDSLL